MGDISDMILEGILCRTCGGLVEGKEKGFPRDCRDCRRESFRPTKYNHKIKHIISKRREN